MNFYQILTNFKQIGIKGQIFFDADNKEEATKKFNEFYKDSTMKPDIEKIELLIGEET